MYHQQVIYSAEYVFPATMYVCNVDPGLIGLLRILSRKLQKKKKNRTKNTSHTLSRHIESQRCRKVTKSMSIIKKSIP